MSYIQYVEMEEKFKEFVQQENFSFLTKEVVVDESRINENIRELEKAFMEVRRIKLKYLNNL